MKLQKTFVIVMTSVFLNIAPSLPILLLRGPYVSFLFARWRYHRTCQCYQLYLYNSAHKDKNQFFIQEFPWFWHFNNVNFVKNEILELWVLWKLRCKKCEFCEKWDFRNVNFVIIEISEMWIEISEMWILWKLRFQKCEFCENCGFSEMWILWKLGFSICDFLEMWIFAPSCSVDSF